MWHDKNLQSVRNKYLTNNQFDHHQTSRAMFYIEKSIHFFANSIPTLPMLSSLPTEKNLQQHYLPCNILAKALFHLHSCTQHKSFPLLDTVSTTSNWAIIKIEPSLAILNVFNFCLLFEIFLTDNLIGSHPSVPTLPWADGLKLLNLVRTDIIRIWQNVNG